MRNRYMLLTLTLCAGIMLVHNGQVSAQNVSLKDAEVESKSNDAPFDLNAVYNIIDPDVQLSWYAAGMAKWIHYDDGENASGIGVGSTDVFDCGIKYTAEELSEFSGMQISKIAYFPNTQGNFTMKIWQGANGADVILNENVSSIVEGEWNIYELATPMVLDVTKTHIFGYTAAALNDSDYPAGTDAGPAIAGKGDLVRAGTEEWETLSGYTLDYNWNIQVYLEPIADAKKAVVISSNEIGAVVSDLVFTNKMAEQTTAFKPQLPRGEVADSFNIYRNDELIATTINAYFADVMPNAGYHEYTVSALYGESESEKSDSVVALYDSARVDKKAILIEDFTSVGCTYCPGAALGIFDMMENGLKIAPIAFHTSAFGDDPFMTAEAEQRASDLEITSYPTVIFDGIEKVTGGHPDLSLYEYYKPIYDELIAIKTPITLTYDITEVDGGIVIDYTISKLGLYNDDSNLVVHTVLVENDIDYDWMSQSKIDFAERTMFPSANGEVVTFVDGVFIKSVNISIEDGWNQQNLKLVSFIQNKNTGEVLDADYYDYPRTSTEVLFSVIYDAATIEDALIIFDNDSLYTDIDGQAVFVVDSLSGGYRYSVTKEGFVAIEGVVNIEETTLVEVLMEPIDSIEVIFYVFDDDGPIEDAVIYGISEPTNTDADGQAFFIYEASYGFMEYWIEKDGYETSYGECHTDESHTIEVRMIKFPEVDVTFKIMDDEGSIGGALVVVNNDSLHTNTEGIAVFSLEQTSNNYEYEVSKNGYESMQGTIYVSETEYVELTLIKDTIYSVTFIVNDGMNPIGNAKISIRDYESLYTDSLGHAVFDNILPALDMLYVIEADNYQDKIGAVSVVDEDVVINIEMIILGVSDLTDKGFKAYPNPASSTIYIDDAEGKMVTIYGINGIEMIRIQNADQHQLVDVSTFYEGVYFVKIDNNVLKLFVKH